MEIKKLMIAVGLLIGLSACDGEEPNVDGEGNDDASANAENTILIWDISTGNEKELVKQEVEDFNSKHDDVQAKVEFFQNDPYKQKLQIAMGADESPDIFYNWGGGVLESYTSSDKVYELTEDLEEKSEWKDKYLDSVMGPVTFDDEIYGIPNTKVQPAAFNYNKEVFEEYDLEVPETWTEFIDVVEVLKENDVIPIALAEKDVWPGLMYLEYFTDRIGGPEVFQNVVDGKKEAWSDPAIIKANEMIQELVEMDAFQDGFQSVEYEGGSADALVYSGKAAMQLDLSSGFNNILSTSPDFIENGNFGWFEFPEIEDGSGDPRNIVGNPSNYYSVSENSKNKEAAIEYLEDSVLNDDSAEGYISEGLVPPVEGVDSSLEEQKYSDWLKFNYDITDEAPNFQMSWDQELSPKHATELLENLDKVFNLSITPKEF